MRLHCFAFVAVAALCTTAFGNDLLTFTQVQNEDVEAKSKSRGQAAPEVSPVGQTVPTRLPIVVGPQTRVELANAHYIARVGGGSAFSLSPTGILEFEKGAVLLAAKVKNQEVELATAKSKFTVRLDGCLMMETTSNGGCKLIGLSGRNTITLEGGGKTTLAPGKLLFVLPEKSDFGPVVHISLPMLLSTSKLVNGFSQSLERIKDLRHASFAQNYRIRGRSKALVGDTISDTNYQVIFLK